MAIILWSPRIISRIILAGFVLVSHDACYPSNIKEVINYDFVNNPYWCQQRRNSPKKMKEISEYNMSHLKVDELWTQIKISVNTVIRSELDPNKKRKT